MLNPENWLDTYGNKLFRYALGHLQNEAMAEDCLQDTLLAALESMGSFHGQSSELTWLTGILKHKIIDLYRKKHHITYESDLTSNEDEDHTGDFFDSTGHWIETPTDWGNPQKLLEEKAFKQTFETCLKNMPAALALIFSCRESLEMNTQEICRALEITAANSRIMLYRARLLLQGCIQTKWGNPQEEKLS
ncbi:MAG: sigma-70 family RNA polymerase sigma factor [Pseudomonadota bacterium]|nr:sigma-70 family RNA polymerase sigma factor [Pseudomonadota bacterium]